MQLKLLANGFRLLKVGGSLVYSTCRFASTGIPWTLHCFFFLFLSDILTSVFACHVNSLTLSQNEDVVEQFLSQNASAGRHHSGFRILSCSFSSLLVHLKLQVYFEIYLTCLLASEVMSMQEFYYNIGVQQGCSSTQLIRSWIQSC